MNAKKLIIKLAIGLILISGCAPASSADNITSAPQAWFDAPLPSTVYVPPNPCTIVAHGASPSGVSQFELSINGTVSANIPNPDSNSSLATLTQECGLTEPGEYFLQIRAQDNDGNWSGYADTSLIIPGEATTNSLPADVTPASANPTFTAIPTLTPLPISTNTPQPTGSISLERISTSLVYVGGTDCGPVDVNFSARATAPNGITAVVLFYRFQSNNASTEFQGIAMNPKGGDLYERALNPTSALGGVAPFDAATLQYQIVIQQADGDTSIRTPIFSDITVQACGRAANSCSSYTDQRACISNGCNWVEIPGIVPVYECRTP